MQVRRPIKYLVRVIKFDLFLRLRQSRTGPNGFTFFFSEQRTRTRTLIQRLHGLEVGVFHEVRVALPQIVVLDEGQRLYYLLLVLSLAATPLHFFLLLGAEDLFVFDFEFMNAKIIQ